MTAKNYLFDAVIFDCDGVLIDSEPIYNRILAELLMENGVSTTTEECIDRYIGMDLNRCIELVNMAFNTTLPPTFVSDYKTRSFESFQTGLVCMPGIEELIQSMTLPLAVASSSGHDELRFTLDLVGLYQRFDGRIFSVDDVERGKPHPDVYFYAAEQLNVDPTRCAVIEDSVNGAKAGIAAGMTVYGYASLTDGDLLRKTGAHVFKHMRELHTLLKL